MFLQIVELKNCFIIDIGENDSLCVEKPQIRKIVLDIILLIKNIYIDIVFVFFKEVSYIDVLLNNNI